MMGGESLEDRGLIPRLFSTMFKRIHANTATNKNITYRVEVSFLEIYLERVQDMLRADINSTKYLKVREHKALGPYVENLRKVAVESAADIQALLDQGHAARHVAATKLNSASSRSHAVFTITLTEVYNDPELELTAEKVAKIDLVDLAGSERATSTGNTGQRLREGALINKSLTVLGR